MGSAGPFQVFMDGDIFVSMLGMNNLFLLPEFPLTPKWTFFMSAKNCPKHPKFSGWA